MTKELCSISIEQAAQFFLKNDDFLILCHASPDGDTLGSGYALCGALQRLGKRAKIACADSLSPRLSHLEKAVVKQDFEEKTIVSVDIADRKLLGRLEEEYGGRVELAIDHHVSHVPFAPARLIFPDAAATCEIIFELLTAMKVKLDEKLAACIYTGIATDTGCFRYSNVTPRTFAIAAELIKFDFGFGALNYLLFEMKSRARLVLEQAVLSGVEFYCEGKCAVVAISKSLLDSADSEDANGIASLPRQIEGVEVSVIIKEKEDCWKISMRSQDAVDVQKICSLFGGGGHIRAAGCSMYGDIESVKRQLVSAICAGFAQ